MSAIQLFSSIEYGAYSLYALLGMGAMVLMAMYMGNRNTFKLYSTLTTSFLSFVGLGLLLGILVRTVDAHLWVHLFCKEPALHSLFQDYAVTRLTYIGFYMLMFWVNALTLLSGKPEKVIGPILTAAAANVVMTYVFIDCFHWGIVGAAYATVVSMAINVLFLLLGFLYKEFAPAFRKFRTYVSPKALKEICLCGYPIALANLGPLAFSYFMNLLVQTRMGVDGVFAWTVFINVSEIGLLVSGGVSYTFLAIGPFLRGQRDMQGVRYLVRISGITIVITGVLLLLSLLCFPGWFARVFGAQEAALVSYTVSGLRLMAWYLPMILLLTYCSDTYIMLGHERLSPVTMSFLPIGLVACSLLCTRLWGNAQLWYAFPLAALLGIFWIVLVSQCYRTKHKNLSFITLAPRCTQANRYDVSMQAREAVFKPALAQLYAYLKTVGTDKYLALRVNLCLEEMMRVIVFKGQRNKRTHCFDVFIHIDADCLVATLKDSGQPFNPIQDHDTALMLELSLLKGMCPQMEYAYMYGQNMTYLTWPLHDSPAFPQ